MGKLQEINKLKMRGASAITIPQAEPHRIPLIDLANFYEDQVRLAKESSEYQQGIAELADDIQRNGLLQPIVVTRVVNQSTHGYIDYVVAGNRRLEAFRMLCSKPGCTIDAKIDCRVFTCMVDGRDPEADEQKIKRFRFFITDAENEQRQNIKPIERALSIYKMVNHLKMSQVEICQVKNLDKAVVSMYCTIGESYQDLVEILAPYDKTPLDVTSYRDLWELTRCPKDGIKAMIQQIFKNPENPVIPEPTKPVSSPKPRTPVLAMTTRIKMDVSVPGQVTLIGKKAVVPEYFNQIKGVINVFFSKTYDHEEFQRYLSIKGLDNQFHDMVEHHYHEYLKERNIPHVAPP